MLNLVWERPVYGACALRPQISLLSIVFTKRFYYPNLPWFSSDLWLKEFELYRWYQLFDVWIWWPLKEDDLTNQHDLHSCMDCWHVPGRNASNDWWPTVMSCLQLRISTCQPQIPQYISKLIPVINRRSPNRCMLYSITVHGRKPIRAGQWSSRPNRPWSGCETFQNYRVWNIKMMREIAAHLFQLSQSLFSYMKCDQLT